ncbi:MAG: CHAT domain-containing protein [Kofleriaceae bacterium]
MSCERVPSVHAFADGELSAADAALVREHLADCQACQVELAEVMQLEAVTSAHAPRAAQVTPLRRRRGQVLGVSVALAAAVALYVAARRPTSRGGAGAVAALAFELPAERGWEARLSWAPAAAHRPYAVARSAELPRSVIPLGTLAELERAGDVHGVGVLALLNGDHRQAEAFLDRAGAGPDVLADRAALALADGRGERALELCDEALELAPGHAGARWNRALALRELGLELAAAGALRQVAALGEAGWAGEAEQRAAALEAAAAERGALTARVLAAGPALLDDPAALSADDARRLPGLARLYVYDALRAASSAQLSALFPLVAALDEALGADAVAALARRAASVAATHPTLPATYREILAGRPPVGAARGRYLAALRAVGANDLLIAALVRLSASGGVVDAADLPELSEVTGASPDPWMKLYGIEQRAQVALAAGDLPAAEALLLRAKVKCQAGGPEAPAFRCIRLGVLLGSVYGRWQRVPEARAEALRTWELARAEREWFAEGQLLESLSSLAVISDDSTGGKLAQARAYSEELVRRRPDDCAVASWARHLVAQVLINRLRLDDARQELAAAPRCDAAVGVDEAAAQIFVRAHLLREQATAAQVRELRDEIAALRGVPGLPAALRASLDHSEGRLLIDGGPGRDAAAGAALLRASIATARGLETADAAARKVVGFGSSVLALAAARAGDGAAALTAIADEQGVPLPARCALGLAVEDRRRMAVARDVEGRWRVHYDERRVSTQDDPRELVTAELLASLAACPVIDVLARPPLHGAARLLPEELAWRYRSARRAPAGAGGGPTVTVGDVEPPAALGLPRLANWRDAKGQTLAGAAATPARVLAALTTASDVVIHAHGVGAPGADDASFLALSADARGDYALTAAEVRAAKLERGPLVVLAACGAAKGAPVVHEPWSLPAAFVYAGARAVVASAAPIPDAEASEFFDAVRAGATGVPGAPGGADVAIAVRDARVRWLARGGADWVKDILVFE